MVIVLSFVWFIVTHNLLSYISYGVCSIATSDILFNAKKFGTDRAGLAAKQTYTLVVVEIRPLRVRLSSLLHIVLETVIFSCKLVDQEEPTEIWTARRCGQVIIATPRETITVLRITVNKHMWLTPNTFSKSNGLHILISPMFHKYHFNLINCLFTFEMDKILYVFHLDFIFL